MLRPPWEGSGRNCRHCHPAETGKQEATAVPDTISHVHFRRALGDVQRSFFGDRAHTFTVLSQLPAASAFPSGEIATQSTSPVCVSRERSRHVALSQRRTSPGWFQSPPPVASVLPSGVNAIAHVSPAWAFR